MPYHLLEYINLHLPQGAYFRQRMPNVIKQKNEGANTSSFFILLQASHNRNLYFPHLHHSNLFIKVTHTFLFFFLFLLNYRLWFLIGIIQIIYHLSLTLCTKTSGSNHLATVITFKTDTGFLREGKAFLPNPFFNLRNRNLTFFGYGIYISMRIFADIILCYRKLLLEFFHTIGT